jgi:hypothetical protein
MPCHECGMLMPNCILLCVGYPGHYPHNADCTWNIQAGFPDGIITKLFPIISLFFLYIFARKLYPKNLNLKKYSMWKPRYQVALGRRIQFHFAALDIESHPNCSFDRVGQRV